MKLMFSTIFVLALLPLLAQSQATTPIPSPQTDCGKAALQCYNKFNGEIQNSMAKVDMTSACTAYANMLKCFDKALEGQDCNGKDTAELSVYQKAAEADADGLCYKNGDVKNCGKDMAQCINDVKEFKEAFSAKNATKACPALSRLETCTKGVVGTGECPDKYDQFLNKISSSFAEDELIEGCDGACGKKAGECTEAFTKAATQPLSQINYSTFCKDTYQAMECIRGLAQQDDCKGDTKNVALAEQMADSIQKYVADLCDADGKPSACNTELQVCIADIKDLSSKMDITQQCQMVAAFLECMSSLKCQSIVKSFANRQKLVIETEERKENCPTIGSCSDRLTVCNERESVLGHIEPGANKEAKRKACRLATKGESCFDVIRKDPYCINEKLVVSDFEQKLKTTINSQCDAAGVTHLSLALFVVSLLASLKYLF